MADLFLVKTMTSLEVAEVTGKAHSNVMRDIRNILEQLEDRGAFKFELTSYVDKSNRESPCYQLTQKDCLLLASGYDANLRAKIINRWEELETEKRNGGIIYRKIIIHFTMFHSMINFFFIRQLV